jgi:isopentenyldiphosphate isomerase
MTFFVAWIFLCIWNLSLVDSFVPYLTEKTMITAPREAVSKSSSAEHHEASSMLEAAHAENSIQRSLASSYLIEVQSPNNQEERWSLTPIQSGIVNGVSTDEALPSEGALAAKALQASPTTKEARAGKACSLVCKVQGNSIVGSSNHGDDTIDATLVAVLLRIMAQRLVAARQAKKERPSWTVTLPGETDICFNNDNTEEFVRILFSPITDTNNVELVEMVTQTGEALGVLPRPLVHSYNLLHRGIGMVVCRDTDTATQELYVHRRTDTKRIFPGLYDMFVGGVSCAGEGARTTAQREVSEELGLKRGLVDETALSDPLFSCIACTSYNRCLVTVFSYTFDGTQDEISWQEEEVAWGDFVPYDDIVESARLCIERMVESKTWPGSTTPYALRRAQKGRTTDTTQTAIGENEVWKTFDYVPDGLLVWEAWLRWRDGNL